MRKIADLVTSNNEEIELILKLSNIVIKKTTSGDDYASMIGFDGNDKIEAKIWTYNEEIKRELVSGEVYKVLARTKQYQNRTQLNILSIEKVSSEEYDLSMFYERAKLTSEDLAKQINGYFMKIDNKILKSVVSVLLKKYFNEFFEYPAAVSMHHNYYSGLAYHTYSMLKLSDAYLELYPYLNKDLVYSGIILHDLGKIIELSGPKGTEYTKKGNLLGHISLGANEVYKTSCDLGLEDTEEVVNLIHIVLSHHGQLEYGSPKEPLTAEATLIHFLDYNDSRLATLENEVNKTQKGEYTQPIPAFDRKSFYIPDIK